MSEYCFVCCGRRFCYDTARKRNASHTRHKKGIKHKISQAVGNAWVQYQKTVKHLPSCGCCGSQLTVEVDGS